MKMTAMKTYSADVSAIEASRGDAFVIELEGLPGAGYRWEAEIPAGVVRLRSRDVHPGAAIGAASKERLTFDAVDSGETEIQLVYKRPWESEAQQTRKVRVKVK